MRKECNTCKYFTKKRMSRILFPEFLGECNSPFLLDTSRWKEEKLYAANCLHYEDCESYGANCFVGELFGCIHWEPKEA